MTDQLGLFDRNDDTGNVDLEQLRAALARAAAESEKPLIPEQRRPSNRVRREAVRRRRSKRRRHTIAAVLILALLACGITAGLLIWRKKADEVPDFAGAAGPEVVVQVKTGDDRTAIAQTLKDSGVVASPEAFLNATTNDGDVRDVRPGFYKLPSHLSAQDAANALVNPSSRVGQLRLVPGRELADVSTKTGGGGTVTPGYISEITKAACVPLNGVSHCFTAAQLWAVEETADAATLNLPEWSINAVNAAPDKKKRLEGLIVPGDVDVPPDSTPLEALQAVLAASATSWSISDIVADANTLGSTPYEVATIASIVERESNTRDMGKVAQVVYNRIQHQMDLQMDSTVNYALDRAQISTTKADRANPSPYNTYQHRGLPPTPISSPGTAALNAAMQPEAGEWLYFVKIDKQGDSCFSVTLAEHNKCVEQARKNGVFDG